MIPGTLELVFLALLVLILVAGVWIAHRRHLARRERAAREFDRTLGRDGRAISMDRFAEELGLERREEGSRPVLSGYYRGMPVAIDLDPDGGLHTRFRARLRTPVDHPLTVTKEGVGAKKLFTSEVRTWLTALDDARVSVRRDVVEALLPGVEEDLDRMRGALELVVELAKAAEDQTSNL